MIRVCMYVCVCVCLFVRICFLCWHDKTSSVRVARICSARASSSKDRDVQRHATRALYVCLICTRASYVCLICTRASYVCLICTRALHVSYMLRRSYMYAIYVHGPSVYVLCAAQALYVCLTCLTCLYDVHAVGVFCCMSHGGAGKYM